MLITNLSAMLPHAVSAVLFGLAVLGIVAAPAASADASGGAPPAAGGDAPPAADPQVEAGADGAVTVEGDSADDADDVDQDVEDLEAAMPHLSESQIRTRLRRAQRYAKRVSPLVNRFKKPGSNEFMSEAEVEAILNGHREFGQVDAILRASPRAVQVLMEEERRLREGGGQPAHNEPAAFDEAAFEAEWPGETDTPLGKRLYQSALRAEKAEFRSAALERRLDSSDKRTETEKVQQLEGQWKNTCYTAANELDESYRPMFVQAVSMKFAALRASGQLTKANAKDVIDGLLKDVRAAKQKATRKTVTSQSATVAANAGLPRTPRPGTVLPSNGDKSVGRETIKDARASFLKKYGGG